MSTKEKLIIVVSNTPLLREGIRLIIEEATNATVTTASDDLNAANRAKDLGARLIIVEYPDGRPIDLNSLFRHRDYPTKVIFLDSDSDVIVTYSRREMPAKLRNLLKALRVTPK